MVISWQFKDTLLVVINYEGGKTWKAYLVANCSASSPHYTAVPEGKHDATLRDTMVAGYWLQIVLFFRDVSTRRVSQFVLEIASCLPCITSYPFAFT